MSERRAIVPIFPLSDVVLFPRLVAPLHIFEPRYRQMTEHALATDRRIAMVVVHPRHSAQMAGDPPIVPVGCLGTIGESKRLPDGRFEFVLLGTQRVRIDDEPARPDGQSYRSAAVTLLDDVFADADVERVAAMRRQVVLAASDFFGDRASEIAGAAAKRIDHETFVNALCLALPFSTTDKQALLEMDTIPERFEMLIELLSFARAERGAHKVPNSGSLH